MRVRMISPREATLNLNTEPVITDGALEGLGDVMCCLGHLVVLYQVVQPRITRTLNNQAYMLCK